MADSTMIGQEQLAKDQEAQKVQNVVNTGVSRVATGVQNYAVKTDGQIAKLTQLLKTQAQANAANQNTIAALQHQIGVLTSTFQPDKLLSVLCQSMEQRIENAVAARLDSEKIDDLAKSKVDMDIDEMLTEADKNIKTHENSSKIFPVAAAHKHKTKPKKLNSVILNTFSWM